MRERPLTGVLWWGVPVVVGLLWVAGLLSVATFPGLPSPPEITFWLLPVCRFSRDIAAALTVGSVVVGGLLVPGGSARALRWAAGWGVAWLGLLVLGLMLTLSDVRALSPLDALSPSTLAPLLIEETVGRVFIAQFICVTAISAGCWIAGRQGRWGAVNAPAASRLPSGFAWFAAVLAVGAASAPAFVGHAGLHDGHVAATTSLALHIAAISLWVGGLAVVVALVRIEPAVGLAAVPRFSLLALWCVIIVAESGLLNAVLRLEAPSEFVGSLYGALIIAKAVLLGWLVRFGLLQRRKAVATGDGVILARYASTELVLMGAAIAISVVLSRLGPAPAGLAGGEYSPLALCLLAIAVPQLVIAWVRVRGVDRNARPSRVMEWMKAHPEVPAVLLLVIAADIAGLQALAPVLGVQLGTIVGCLMICGAGWLWAAAVSGPRGGFGVIVVMIGWPIITWFNARMTLDGANAGTTGRVAILSVVLAEALLIAMLWTHVSKGRPGSGDTRPAAIGRQAGGGADAAAGRMAVEVVGPGPRGGLHVGDN